MAITEMSRSAPTGHAAIDAIETGFRFSARRPAATTSVYLAARYARRLEMRVYAGRLRSAGIEVTSRWVDEGEDHQTEEVAARVDIYDLSRAATLLTFTESEGVENASSGGRHVEFGLGVAWRKRIIVVGYRENVFHHLSGVEFYPTFDEAMDALTPDAQGGQSPC